MIVTILSICNYFCSILLACMLCSLPTTAQDMQAYTPERNFINITEYSFQKPVVLSRYLGYKCLHCVQQIILLNNTLDSLQLYNAQVFALSSDTPEITQELQQEYRWDKRLTFLCDTAHTLAEQLRTRIYEENGEITELHGIFIIYQGSIVFAQRDIAPFMDMRTLLANLRLLSEKEVKK